MNEQQFQQLLAAMGPYGSTAVAEDNLSVEKFVKRWTPLVESYQAAIPSVWDSKYARPFRSDYERAVTALLMENIRKNLMPGTKDIGQAWKTSQDLVESGDGSWPEGIIGEATTPNTTAAWSGATVLPVVLGMARKLMPRIVALELVQMQALDRPQGRVFFLNRVRHNNGTDAGNIENRAGWSYRSFVNDPGEGSTIIKSVRLNLTSADVSVVSRKLLAETTVEIEDDLRAFFGLDAMDILADAAVDEIALEISEDILYRLWNAATGTSGGGIVYYGARPTAYDNDISAWERKLIECYNRNTELIETRRRVAPNWLVAGSEPAIRIGQLGGFEKAPTMGVRPMGLRRIGNLMFEWDAYKMQRPFPTADTLFGYKGTGWSDAGFFWLPYIPLRPYATFRDPRTMVQVVSWIRRDAYYLVSPGYYGKTVIDEANYTGISHPDYVEYVS